MSDLTSYLSTVNRPPVKFHPPKNLKLPKSSFGTQGKDRRSFRTVVCMSGTYCWLHYDVSQDSAFYVCITAEFEKKCLASTKRDPAFITTGYTYWIKEAVTPLRDANSACHREAIEAVETLPAQVQDIGELLDASTQSE